MEEYNIELYNYNKEMYRRKVLLLFLYTLHRKKKHHRSKPRWNVKPFLKERRVHGHCHCLTNEMQLTNSVLYQNFIRMSASTYEELICLIGPKIMRYASRPDILSVNEVLTATLRYLASGESMMSVMYAFRIGKSTVSNLILQCCSVLWDTLNPKVLIVPNTYKWAQLAEEFENKWQMPNCFGSIDGKHIVHQAFANSGSSHYNYKGSNSIILLAMCDASYNFVLVDIGAAGRCSDGGVFSSSEMGKSFINNTLNVPTDKEIGQYGLIPFYAVADEAFPLLKNLMRPFPGRGKRKLPLDESIFNYRLSRSRRTIENTFGIMASKWRIFRRPIIAGEKTVNAITKAVVVLHNFVKMSEKNAGVRYYSGPLDVELIQREQWRSQEMGALASVHQLGTNTYSTDAKIIRNKLKDYFSAEGAIAFQYENI